MEQQQGIYRESSLEKISSPDQLDQYLKVTTPAVWILLVAVILLLGVAFWWSSQTAIASKVTATGTVKSGVLTIPLETDDARKNVKEGMNVVVGELTDTINYIQTTEDGGMIAVAIVSLPDGTYPVSISYKTTQLISLLFN